jgi:hypothetical protein
MKVSGKLLRKSYLALGVLSTPAASAGSLVCGDVKRYGAVDLSMGVAEDEVTVSLQGREVAQAAATLGLPGIAAKFPARFCKFSEKNALVRRCDALAPKDLAVAALRLELVEVTRLRVGEGGDVTDRAYELTVTLEPKDKTKPLKLGAWYAAESCKQRT